MKFIQAYKVKDLGLLGELTSNNPVFSRTSLKQISRQYALARARKCDTTKVPRLNPEVSANIRSALQALFRSKRKCLWYIRSIRNELSPDVCPMCGSKSSAQTVDHFLGRANYPELTLFSLNLVPACGCNSVRQMRVAENPFHPYFDEVLKEPLIRAKFSGDYEAPRIALTPNDGFPEEIRSRISSHIESILIPNKVLSFLMKRWRYVVSSPERSLSLSPGASVNAVRDAVQRRRDEAHADTDTPNNWESILYDGILQDNRVLIRLVQQLAGTPPEMIPNI